MCPDQTQPGFTHPGSFAERVAVRAADFNLVRLPDAVDFVSAAALGCRFATAYHALTQQSSLGAGQWLAVFGCGGVGLSAVMIGRALGARVLAVDPSEAARARAAHLGADAGLAEADPTRIAQLTDGGPHVTLDALGSGSIADVAIRSLRRRGRHVQVGLMMDSDAAAPLPWGAVIAKELHVVGSHGMPAGEYPAMLDLMASGRLDPSRLVGRVVTLGDVGAELAAMDEPIPATPGLVVAEL